MSCCAFSWLALCLAAICPGASWTKRSVSGAATCQADYPSKLSASRPLNVQNQSSPLVLESQGLEHPNTDNKQRLAERFSCWGLYNVQCG